MSNDSRKKSRTQSASTQSRWQQPLAALRAKLQSFLPSGKRPAKPAPPRSAAGEPKTTPNYRARRLFVLGLLALGGLGLTARAVQQQILETDFLQREGQRRHVRVEEVNLTRGVILDRNQVPLAVSAPVYSVWANPRALLAMPPEQTEFLNQLALLLGRTRAQLDAQLERSSRTSYTFLRRRLTPDEAEPITQLLEQVRTNRVGLEREYRRFYPTGEVFAQLLGFTDVDDQGQEGLELLYDQQLRGAPGRKRVVRDGHAKMLNVESLLPAQRGEDIRLSLDQRIQYITYTSLKETVRQSRARHGHAILLDTRNGEILAMASYPAFNPNGEKRNRDESYLNRPLTDQYEPGSTMKPFTVACAIDAGRVDLDSTIDTNPGSILIGNKRITDARNYGEIDLATLIARSSNVGSTKVALMIPPTRFWECLNRFGFGVPTHTRFPGEGAGQLAPTHRWSQIRHANLSFGYGLTVTSLQLARAYATLAADGVRRPVSLLPVEQLAIGERAINSDAAWSVRAMMEGSTARGGTGLRAAIPGYRVAGKTGTVKKVIDGRYSDDRHLALFAGIAPASNPRLAMVVVIDEPRGQFYGGVVAAPVFSRVVGQALRLLNVPPDDLGPDGVRLAAPGVVP